uniref:Protein kinase domain-containing protein n=1 Tax=Vitis vinifera TaxID=29760 RepID=A5C559_VITVI|nr:hypothetical protein VITISV_043906 [Vitis vinifera]
MVESDDEVFEFSRNRESGSESDCVVQSVIKLDRSLLIDLSSLRIGSMISEGRYKSMPVAIKMIQPNKTSAVSPDRKEKFQREVTILSRVKHENIVKFIGASIEPTMMIITELMKGGTLQQYLWSIRPNSPDLKLSLSFALDISRVMEYLHANGIIHRDLKPSNLLLTEDKKQIKVCDFGLAREETAGDMTTEAGTYRWMAPELFSTVPLPRGAKIHYDHKVDVYSFAIILWELLTNRTPFKGVQSILIAYAAANNERPSVENIPQDIAPFLQSCWAEDPANRPEFMQITNFLVDFLQNLCSAQITPAQTFEIEHPRSNVTADSAGSNHPISKVSGKMKARSPLPCFLRCFDDCLPD